MSVDLACVYTGIVLHLYSCLLSVACREEKKSFAVRRRTPRKKKGKKEACSTNCCHQGQLGLGQIELCRHQGDEQGKTNFQVSTGIHTCSSMATSCCIESSCMPLYWKYMYVHLPLVPSVSGAGPLPLLCPYIFNNKE